jgi:hypothetical protein
MQHFLLGAVAILVVSAAGHSVSRGTSILFASNVPQMAAGDGGVDVRNRGPAQQLRGTDHHNLQMAAGGGGLDLRDREVA